MFAVPNNEKSPVKTYKVYAEKRPAEMKTDQPSPQAFSLDSLSARSLGETGREN